MDVDEALRLCREAAQRVRNAETSREAGEAADALADAFEALDGWLSAGGFRPKEWIKA